MGAVSSMCCEAEKSNHGEKTLPKPTKSKPEKQRFDFDDKKQKIPKPEPVNPRPNDERPPPEIIPPKQDQPEKQDPEEYINKFADNFPPPADKKVIKWESFQIDNRIGCGGFGEVFEGQLIDNKIKGIIQKYAIKRIPKAEIFRRKLTSSIKLEKRILQQSDCNFITTLFYAFRDSKFLYLVMELAQGGDTYSLINERSNRIDEFKKAGQPAVRFILACLILGMEYLHSKNIMYRDLKPQNVLIFENGYVKLTDFGLAKEIQQEQLSKTQAGTTIYYAPQMVLREGYGKEIDLWTIGIFAYEMSNYYPPFTGPQIKDKQRVKRLVKAAETKRTWKNPRTSDELKNFIDCLLKFDPKQRIGYKSWDQIKNHKFFSSVNFQWQSLIEMKMESPLKSIIQKFPPKYKPYIPTQDNKHVSQNLSKSADDDLQGWSCLNTKKV